MSVGTHDLEALLRACKADPTDDAVRRVLADWLEEHGDGDRAEVGRLRAELGLQALGPRGHALGALLPRRVHPPAVARGPFAVARLLPPVRRAASAAVVSR